MIQQHILRCSRIALGMSQLTSNPGSIFSTQKRYLNNCLHAKGLPTNLSKEEIYTFFRDNYGKVVEFASYDEAPLIAKSKGKKASDKSTNNANGPDLDEGSGEHDPTKRVQTRRKFITHNRVPGKTVIIKFESIESAFMCREELHWRPFPSEEYVLTEDIVMTEPRDRPLVNILFDNTVLRDRIRGWVCRDLSMSRAWIRQKEKKRATKQT
uniref:Uncharacterized protein n=1 Tax=Chaetoceros debilis TaxID=122233 RepID=A0A7S3Q5Y1_9STRA